MQTILVADDWLLTPERVAVHVPTQTAVVADLHLGYHKARQAAGDAIPAPTLASQLQPLLRAQRRAGFTRLVVAGDLFERAFCQELADGFARFLEAMGVAWTALVPGNHDRRLDEARLPCPVHEDGFDLAGWRIIHGDGAVPEGKVVMGHLHPCWTERGRRWPCYVTDGRRLILPAFSTDAAGGRLPAEYNQIPWQSYVIEGTKLVYV